VSETDWFVLGGLIHPITLLIRWHDTHKIACYISRLSQFLWTADRTRLKLNDFNRAEFMLWDEEHQEYCKYTEGRGQGNVSDDPHTQTDGVGGNASLFGRSNRCF
jgi:hypothetical protein